MALMRLVSDGKSTFLELEGKEINYVKGISFSQGVEGDSRNGTLHLDIDLRAAYASFASCGEYKVFTESRIDKITEDMKRGEEELHDRRSSEKRIIRTILDGQDQDDK